MKAWQQRDAARDTLSREVGYVRKPHTDRLRVALAFPNTYFVGMSNLGFQTVYRLFNDQPDVVCERVFLPPKQELKSLMESGARLVSVESQTPIGDFDVIAFSVSFEWDYTNVLTMLRLAGLEPRAEARGPRDPLVIVGGAVTFVNPEPLALFADVIAAGEGEVLIPGLMAAAAESTSRPDLLRRLAATRGYYIPSFYDVEYHADGTIARYVPREG
ncbi:MAG: B12-binding domain-containing radical SAM protein, partial [Vicinamibacterales bacterium]